MTVIEKPPFGTPCNRCGLCCREELCPLALSVFGAIPGPCPGLTAAPDGVHSCGLYTDPRLYAPARTAIHGAAAMREAAGVLISAGDVCDGEVDGEYVLPSLRKALYDRWDEFPDYLLKDAYRKWGMLP